MPDLVWFSRSEFKCPCCGEERMKDSFLDKLDNARQIAGVPFRVESGWRCEKHNREVGGVSRSEHVDGEGVDIEVVSSEDRYKIVKAATLVGIKRIGIGRSFVHLGGSSTLPSPRIWHYYGGR